MDRVRRRPRLFGPPRHGVLSRATAIASVPLVLVLLSIVLAPAAGAVAGSSSVESASVVAVPTTTNPALTLAAQSPWVSSAQPTFDVRLRPSSTTGPASRLGLSVAVYPCLSSLSGFDQSLSASGLGTPSTATRQAIPVASLPATGGVVDLSLPVVVGGGPVSGAPFTIDLVSTSGQCQAFPSGVFPVRIQLVDTTTDTVLGSLVTHLVYSPSAPPSQKLRVAVVVPLQMALAAAPATAAELAVHPSAALEAPSAGTMAGLTGTVAALANHRTVPVTLSVSGQALEALSAARQEAAIDQLSSLALDTAGHQVLNAPFVPVDASALVNSGLTGELSLQLARGAQVSAPVTHQPPAPQAGAGQGPWVSSTGLDANTVAALQSAGFQQVVVPPSAVAQAPTDGSASVPFVVSGARGTQLSAVATSADLTARFAATTEDPVLAAHQLAAELAQIFFEKPNAVTPRGVIVVPPNGWSASPAFVDALLGALDGNPMLLPVTAHGLFAAVPTSTSCRTDCRLTGAPGGSALPAGAVRKQRNRVNAFASAAGTSAPARAIGTQLSDLVLSGQSALLRPAQQASVEASAGRALDAQLQRVSIGGGQVTLTSQQGTLPVTVTSAAPYPVQVTMTLSSDKLSFPSGSTQWAHPGVITLVPAPHTNVIDVPVRTRGSGLFPVEVVLRSPDGGLEIASGTIDVRSTAASVVGILLSAGAVLVLAVWWYRTSRRRRAARRREESQETHPRVPAGVP